MPNSPPQQNLFRLSLRELLVLVALVALAISSLRYASDVWLALVATVTMTALFVALIVAAVDRGPRQAFAIGFALVALAYAFVVVNGKSREFDHWQGRLPTTHVLRYVHTAVDRSEWTPEIPVLRRGAKDDLVAMLQQMLNDRLAPSPNLEIDGDFGPRTERAVRLLQTDAGLEPTGVTNLETWKELGLSFDAKTRQIVHPPFAGSTTLSRRLSLLGGGSFREIPPREVFMPIGHCWWALVLGYAGGQFARFVYWRRVRDEQPLAGQSS